VPTPETLKRLRRIYDKFLEVIAVIMMVAVTAVVVAGFTYRWLGFSLVWYDEIASISLCWLTYYGSALAALRGAHIGFSGFVNSLQARWRVAATVTASAINIFFFSMLAWMGLAVVRILKGDTLVSIPWLSLQVTQSVIPIAATLFVIAELLRLPELVREARRGPLEDPELKIALQHAAQGGKDIKP
jgi:TRAP-type C4-dicarboxylate transport system permease small subunit